MVLRVVGPTRAGVRAIQMRNEVRAGFVQALMSGPLGRHFIPLDRPKSIAGRATSGASRDRSKRVLLRLLAQEFVEARGDRLAERQEPDRRLTLLAVLPVEGIEHVLDGPGPPEELIEVGCDRLLQGQEPD